MPDDVDGSPRATLLLLTLVALGAANHPDPFDVAVGVPMLRLPPSSTLLLLMSLPVAPVPQILASLPIAPLSLLLPVFPAPWTVTSLPLSTSVRLPARPLPVSTSLTIATLSLLFVTVATRGVSPTSKAAVLGSS